MAPLRQRFDRTKAALAVAGLILLERLGDELATALSDGLLTPVIQALTGA